MMQSTGDSVASSNARAGLRFFVDLWQKITLPHPTISDLQTRQQARLLAALTFSLLSSSLVASLVLTLAASGQVTHTVMLLFPAQVLTLGVYLLNRRGHYRLSAAILVGLNFLLVHAAPIITNEVAWLLFASMMLLLSASFLPIRVTFGLFGVSLGLQAVTALVYPMSTDLSNVGTLVVFLITGCLLLAFMNHRARLELERQAELRQINQQLRESEAALEQRVLERTQELRQAKDSIEAALKRAEAADRLKSQFLAAMSHELRTPLNAVLTFTELLAMGTFGPVNDEQASYLQKSLQSGKHLLALINDVLDTAKIQSGMMKLYIEDDFDVAAELDTLVILAEKMLAGQPVELVVDIDRDFPPLPCDKRRIRQVLLNLLSNAVKHTEQGTITLCAKKRANEILFAVIDTGPGIPEDRQEIMFDPFIQTITDVRQASGVGLGLTIAKQLVEAHGGRLWVESTTGEGAAFFVTLPLRSEFALGEKEVSRDYAIHLPVR